MSTVIDGEFEEQTEDDISLEHDSSQGFNEDLDIKEDDAEMSRARRMGWAPKDEFRGDPERWIDHEEFLRRGDEKLPILRERLRKQDEEIAGMRKDMRKVIRGQGEYQRQVREDTRKEFENRKRAAVEEADTTAFDQATREQMEWEEKHPPAPAAPEGDEPVKDPNFLAWQEKNSWYGTNEEMSVYAESMMPFIKRTRPEVMGTPHFYTEVEKLVRKQYPEHFENPKRDRPNTVGGGRGPTGGRGNRKTYADLPAAAKRKCDEYLENGEIESKEYYVKEYFSEETE